MPLERTEVVGASGAAVVVENDLRVTYYRPGGGAEGGYGRAGSFYEMTAADAQAAPLFWEPEFSLGQLYNNNMFTLGYVPEVLHFCEAVLEGRPITKGTLETALEIMKLYDFYANTKEGVSASI